MAYIAYSKECDYCQADNEGKRKFWEAEEETSHHILCECPTFSTLRQSIFGETIMNNLDLPNLKGIQITLKKIVKFFEATKVMERPNKFENGNYLLQGKNSENDIMLQATTLKTLPLGLTPFALKVRLKGVTGSSQATSLGWFLASHQAGWVPVAYFPQETLPP